LHRSRTALCLFCVDAQRRLRDICHRRIGRKIELFDIRDGLNQHHRARDLPHRALDFGMSGMTDQDHRAALTDIALALVMNLGHQRAGGVDHRQIAIGRFALHAFRNAMRAEDRDCAVGNLRHVLDEPGALRFQRFDHVFVMDDLVTHIDRRAVFLQGALDDVDRPHHAGAKPARLGQHDIERTQLGPGGIVWLTQAAPCPA
jgi:hypothetical protein